MDPTASSQDGPDAAAASPATTGIGRAEDASFRDSLDRLSRLGMRYLSLQDMLTNIAEFAVRAIPGADGAGLTLFRNDQPDTVVATADFVRRVDTVQYQLGEGPCITAAAERRTVRSGALGVDRAFPRFGPRASSLGVQSVLSLPLLAAEGSIGSMNVYAHMRDVFADRAVELGELFAVPATISVQNALALSQAQRLATQLQTALTNRAVIDQALGIMMSRSGGTPDEAFDALRTMSQRDNLKLAVVAKHVVDEAVRRARARRGDQ